jgi:hypothetical protein
MLPPAFRVVCLVAHHSFSNVHAFQRDEINVAYILGLLAEVSRDANSLDASQRDESVRKRKLVMDMLGSEAQLRSKRDLIEQFIEQHMPKVRIPTYPVGCSDNIRSVIPGYPVT